MIKVFQEFICSTVDNQSSMVDIVTHNNMSALEHEQLDFPLPFVTDPHIIQTMQHIVDVYNRSLNRLTYLKSIKPNDCAPSEFTASEIARLEEVVIRLEVLIKSCELSFATCVKRLSQL